MKFNKLLTISEKWPRLSLSRAGMLGCLLLSYFLQAGNGKPDTLSSSVVNGLKFRSIGPALMSGRIGDFAVEPGNRSTYYVAVASGGVWKTENSGTTWDPVFEAEKSYSIGCVTIDPGNYNVVWVGTGENNSQRSVAWGDGVYKSEDRGKSWKNMGLAASEHIAKIVVDPRNSNVVFVASQGPLWGPGGERGLYKTTDGGKTWNQALKITENTGVTDIVMDPRNPEVLYAASYQRRRHVFTLIDGGPESAVYKSTDGGATWDKLTRGLPSVDMGRIGLAISPVNPDVLYAIIETAGDEGGVFRSTDRGASWEKRNGYRTVSPQYYNEIFCDPKDADRIYVMDTHTAVSDDGGKSFKNLGNKSRHVDDHAFWADPEDPAHYLIGGDGGIYETFNRGADWNYKPNLPVTQFYRVSADNSSPFYYVYGGTQDNNSVGGPSRTTDIAGIVNSDWFITNGGDGFESQVDPLDPNIVYAQSQYGWLVRFDRRSGESTGIRPIEEKGAEPYRWNWDSPLIISPHKNTRLYFAANKVFRSEDRGDSWEVVSPDLTRQLDRDKLPVMGKIWSVDAVSKNASTSFFGNIVSLAESPLQEGLLFAGTDDGVVSISRDGGITWQKREKIAGVPDMTYVSCIYPSKFDASVVYAAFDNHKNADFRAYLMKSSDGGITWKSIGNNLPAGEVVYTIQEDHVDNNLLFIGTEYGVWFSNDGGAKWIKLKAGLPTIAVKDMDIQKRENDLVIATFGRGFYILDDYSPLRYLSKDTLSGEASLFPVKDALMFIPSSRLGGSGKTTQGESYFTADNPRVGAVITYYLRESLKTKKELRREAEKAAVKKGETPPCPSREALKAEDDETAPYLLFTITDEAGNTVRRLKAAPSAGVGRIIWDFRYPSTSPARADYSSGDRFFNPESGMLALPGKYKVSFGKVVDGVYTPLAGPVKFNCKMLENLTLPDPDEKATAEFYKKVNELRRVLAGTGEYLDDLRDRFGRMKNALKNAPEASPGLMADLLSLEKKESVIRIKLNGDESLGKRNENQAPSVNDRLSDLVWNQWQTRSAITQTQKEAYRIAAEEFTSVYNDLKMMVEQDLQKLETRMESVKAPWTPGRLPEWK